MIVEVVVSREHPIKVVARLTTRAVKVITVIEWDVARQERLLLQWLAS